MYLTHLSTHPSVDTWLLWMMLWKWTYRYLFTTLLSVYWEVESLDNVLILSIWRNHQTSPTAFYIPTKRPRVPVSFCILTNTCYLLGGILFFLIVAMLMGMRWYHMAFFGISLMISDVEHLFMSLLAIYSSLEKCRF